MDEFIGELAAKAGIERSVAEKALNTILRFLRKEGPPEQMHSLIDQIPGAETAIQPAGSGGGIAGMLGDGVMVIGTRWLELGLGMNEIQNIARELFKSGRDKIGAGGMRVIITETPGLSKFA